MVAAHLNKKKCINNLYCIIIHSVNFMVEDDCFQWMQQRVHQSPPQSPHLKLRVGLDLLNAPGTQMRYAHPNTAQTATTTPINVPITIAAINSVLFSIVDGTMAAYNRGQR